MNGGSGKPLLGGIFGNALASTTRFVTPEGVPTYASEEASAGMHNTLTCPNCGAPRERAQDRPLACRYCGTTLQPKATKA
jgi:hypothetical protein